MEPGIGRFAGEGLAPQPPDSGGSGRGVTLEFGGFTGAAPIFRRTTGLRGCLLEATAAGAPSFAARSCLEYRRCLEFRGVRGPEEQMSEQTDGRAEGEGSASAAEGD